MLDIVSENRFRTQSLQNLLTLVERAAPNPVKIASDILGKNDTVLLRAGQPITPTVLNYLKTNDNYVPDFAVEASSELRSGCRGPLFKRIESTVASERIGALSRAFAVMKVPVIPLLNEVFSESKLLFSYFHLLEFGEDGGKLLFEHSLLTAALTLGIARELDDRFKEPPRSTEAFRIGLFHDLSVPDYLERVARGREAVEEPTHASESADLAAQWGLPAPCVAAIRRHHEAFEGKPDSRGGVPTAEEEILTRALATAEQFATLCDLLGKTKEDEACFMVAHLADQGKLDKDAVRSLGLVIHAKQIVSDVERLSQIEHLCPHGEFAYVYPKVVHATPTKVVCRGNLEECPLFIAAEPPLVVLNQAGETSLAEGMLALPPGEYRKCALSAKLSESVA